MSKVAWVFPGQGSQTVGMGQTLASAHDVVRDTFAEADDILGMPLSTLCFEGPEEKLTETVNTQPALVATSVATARLLEQSGLHPRGAAGHSLGEYSALVVAGAMSFADALTTVRLRGRLMQEASPDGTMAAVLGLDRSAVEALCHQVPGVLEPATYNAPGQIVVAGEKVAVDRFIPLAKEAGARRVVLLNVSGPFHSSLLEKAGRALGDHLADIQIKRPSIPVVSNVTGRVYTSGEEIKDCLMRQVSEAVLWEDSVTHLIASGFTRFLEVGPGRVLSGLIRRIDRQTTVANVDSVDTFQAVLNERGDE